VGLCRLVAGVVGAREALDEEVIADLKLVVTEACACFVWRSDEMPLDNGVSGVSDAPGSLRVDFKVMPDSWEITVSNPEHCCRGPRLGRCDPMSEGGLGLTIIKALVDSVEQTDNEAGGSVLRLVKRLPPRPIPAV
jgi:hypothetical protein